MTARLYALLLRAYPREFRKRFAADMTAAFLQLAAERRARGGLLALWTLWLRTLVDVAVNAAGERRAPRARHGRAGSMTMAPHSLMQDLRYAARTMRRAPGLTLAVVLTVALGAGASAAILSIVRAVMLRPLPYADPGGLLTIWTEAPTGSRVASGWLGPRLGERLTPIAVPYLEDLRARSTSFSAIAGFSPSWEVTLTGSGEASSVQAIYVSDGMLDMLGLQPMAGRDFSRQDHERGSARVVLMSEAMWSHVGGRGAPDGRPIRLNGLPHAVVGLLPPAARLPATPGDIWIPFVHNPFAEFRQIPLMTVLARLRPGVTLNTAREELKSVARSLERDFSQSRDHGLAIVWLSDRMARRSRPLLLVLAASVTLLVLIAVANVANLLLAQASARRREIAVRAALGAGRRRIVQQVLTESVLLGLAGAAAGVVLAHWTLSSLVALLAEDLPPGADVRIDGFVLAGTASLACAAGIVFGLAPAFAASRSEPSEALRHGVRAGAGGGRLRQALVTIEVALAFVLLTGSGLLLRSFWRLTDVDPGFRTERLLSVSMSLPDARYPSGAARAQLFERLLAETRSLPGIRRAALVNRLPLSGSTNNAVSIEIQGWEPDPERLNTDRRIASPDYFRAMAIPLVAGRLFEEGDTAESPRVAVINREMARRFWPGTDPIGAQVRIALLSGPGPWLTIVGVVGDVRHHGLDAEVRPELWVPYSQAPVSGMVLIAQTDVAPESLIEPLRRTVQTVDPELPVTPVTLESVVAASVAGPRSRTLLVSAFAAVALLLATVGIAGVVAYTVSRMTRDIGVRLALGANRASILQLVLRQALAPALAGLALGAVGALAATRWMGRLLFDITPSDPVTLAAVAAGLFGVAAAASLLPALRATRVDPVSVLRID